MKRIIFVLIAVAFIGSLFFVQQASAADEAKTVIAGKIGSVTKVMGKPPKWLYAILTVVADSGEKVVVYIPKATPVTDASGKDMSEGGKVLGAILLKEGQRVEVTYVTGTLMVKSRNEGLAIRCLD